MDRAAKGQASSVQPNRGESPQKGRRMATNTAERPSWQPVTPKQGSEGNSFVLRPSPLAPNFSQTGWESPRQTGVLVAWEAKKSALESRRAQGFEFTARVHQSFKDQGLLVYAQFVPCKEWQRWGTGDPDTDRPRKTGQGLFANGGRSHTEITPSLDFQPHQRQGSWNASHC